MPPRRAVLRAMLVLAAVPAASCAGAGTPSPRDGGPAPSRWDDFRRPDGPLVSSDGGRLPSGQTWRTTFAADPATARDALRIGGGGLRFESAGAAYAWTTGEDAPDAVAVAVAFLPGAAELGANALGLLVSSRPGPEIVGPGGLGVNSVHTIVGTRGWNVALGTGSGLDPVASGTHRLEADGRTVHRVGLRRTAPDTVVLDLPDGGSHTITDPRIAALWGPSVLVEHYQPAATADARPLVVGYRVLP